MRRRIIQCVVASPGLWNSSVECLFGLLAVLLISCFLMLQYAGCPNRKSRMSPNVKVAAFSNYAPRLLVESSSKKSEHHDGRHHEETIDTYNGLSGSDAAELTSNRDAEIAVDLQHMYEEELPGNVLINTSLGEMETVDEAEVEEDKYVKDVRSETRRTPATEFVAATRGSWVRFCPSAPVGLEEEEERLGNNSCLILIHPDDSHI